MPRSKRPRPGAKAQRFAAMQMALAGRHALPKLMRDIERAHATHLLLSIKRIDILIADASASILELPSVIATQIPDEAADGAAEMIADAYEALTKSQANLAAEKALRADLVEQLRKIGILAPAAIQEGADAANPPI